MCVLRQLDLLMYDIYCWKIVKVLIVYNSAHKPVKYMGQKEKIESVRRAKDL